MYDDTCRFLAENFSADFASWLLGESITLTELKPSELSLEPIRADALILLQSDDSVLHLEFQTHEIPDPITQANLTAASAILAGIRLEEEIIYRLLRRDIMQESVIYRSIQEEAETKAKASMQREIAVNLLHAGVAINIIASTTGLAIEDVQQLQQQITEPPQA
ncbi:MAG: hypothetical protein RMY64_29045 [Nostoc sp. DedQUE08]|uniref:hypothetical protein n=1 Tax=unclassified Nostoc TaxID=2593658 RepID=UPI002AD4038F|nr:MULTISPECIES: hypothetical protein [unclassified Nostoc]MDZ8069611.1 hypothetical protein [Nostoc sp. DedQUE08]MDZ8095825.1 hypothetical protein [Nostoc sp. DedQUE05]